MVKKIYAGLFNGDLISFNIKETQFDKIDELTNSITVLDFNNKSRLLFAGTSVGKVSIFDTKNGNKLVNEITNNETLIESIATDATSTLLAIASSNKTIQIFDIYDWQKSLC